MEEATVIYAIMNEGEDLSINSCLAYYRYIWLHIEIFWVCIYT